ncbi:MAG: hypothetical protein KDD40_11235 [Bdellovibrionales bacterium]|nr:hypothetical protein [Bdellovibrionales bacterium]
MKKMWNKCSSIEKILVVLSTLLFTSAIVVLFYFEKIFPKNQIHPDDKIAEVVKVEQKVRRRMPMSFEFDNLEEGDVIGNGDSIFSGDNSQIMVKFLKGSQLIIGEQSLVVLREIDGKLDLKIDKGNVSGSLSESEEIEIQAEDESVTINGEKDAQFSVSYKPGMGMEIISYDKNVKVKYRGNEVEMKNKKAIVSDKKGIEINKNSLGGGKDAKEVVVDRPQDLEVPAKLPRGVEVDDVKMYKKKIALGAPFPVANQVFLHSKGGQIPIFPKEQCIEGCNLTLQLNGQTAMNKSFAKNTVPLIYLKVDPNIHAEVDWQFTDGTDKFSGKFTIEKNNEENMSKALINQYPVEVIN